MLLWTALALTHLEHLVGNVVMCRDIADSIAQRVDELGVEEVTDGAEDFTCTSVEFRQVAAVLDEYLQGMSSWTSLYTDITHSHTLKTFSRESTSISCAM